MARLGGGGGDEPATVNRKGSYLGSAVLCLAGACSDTSGPSSDGPGPFASLSAGANPCALTPAGALYCWGADLYGLIPTKLTLPAGLSFTSVTAGNYHNCGLAPSGAAYCWGGNDEGRLGDGTTTGRSAPVPVVMPSGVSFASLALAVGPYGTHTCGLTTAGAAYCWGGNDTGQLGDGTTTGRLTPGAVATPAGVTFTSLSAGGQHTCGLTPAGTVYCWGDNEQGGQLGDGTTIDRLLPTAVVMPAGVSFASLSVRGYHSCGLTSGAAAYCWGWNRGQVGDGTATDRLTPTAVVMPAGVSFTTLAAGYDQTCALTPAGAAYCWGRNGSGQVGDGTMTMPGQPHRTMPVAVVMPPGVTFASLAPGWAYACALTAAGAAYCWGANHNGQLGDGTTETRLIPVKVVQQ